MKRMFFVLSALGLLAATMAPLASAKSPVSNAASSQDQAQTEKEKQDKAENDAYKAWYDVHDKIPQALPLAEAYLQKFPDGQNGKYLKTWVLGAKKSLFNDAYKAKNIDAMIKTGNDVLADDPDDLDYIYLIASTISQVEIHSAQPNLAHADQEIDFTNRAIKLIEAGKRPSWIKPENWNKNEVLGYLYYDLGYIADNRKDLDKALEDYKQSYTLDPKNAFSYFAAGTIYQAKYVAALQKYQAIPDADKNPPDASTPVKPEVKAALDEVNKEADAVIDAWAHLLALTAEKNTIGPVRDKVAAALPALYKYRHPDSPDGLQKLIDQYRGAAPPAAAAPTQPASSSAAAPSSSKPPAGGSGF